MPLCDINTYFVLCVDVSFALNQMFDAVDVSAPHSHVKRSAVQLHTHTVTAVICLILAAVTAPEFGAALPCRMRQFRRRGPAVAWRQEGVRLDTLSGDTWTTAVHNTNRARGGKNIHIPY